MFRLFILYFFFFYYFIESIRIEDSIKNIIINIGEDPKREGLLHTPERFAKSINFLTSGYNKNITEIIGNGLFNDTVADDDIIIVKDIEMYSLCEHHLLPFFGKVHIAYIPNGKILGLSKFAKIIEMYSRRFQVQERLTREIANEIFSITGAKGVIVGIEACHLCMMMRGVQKQNSKTLTKCILGDITNFNF